MARDENGREWGRCLACRRLSPAPVCVDCKAGRVVSFEAFWRAEYERAVPVPCGSNA